MIEHSFRYRLGTEIRFEDQGNGQEYTLDGCSAPESWGTWTEGAVATLGLRLSEQPDSDLTLDLASYAFIGGVRPRSGFWRLLLFLREGSERI